MTDLSDALFGPDSTELGVRVGAVAMLAALLESDLEMLASSVGDLRQDEVAGVGAERAMQTIEDALAESYGAEEEHDFVSGVVTLIAEARSALEQRNLVVHGLWSVAQPGQYFVWKPRRRNKTTADWTEGEKFTDARLDEIIGTLRRLHTSVRAASSSAASYERRPSPGARERLRPKTRVVAGDDQPHLNGVTV